ncbi:MAG: hypothetical protein ACOYXY_09625 [Thermodesulfobacteriota bacterium]
MVTRSVGLLVALALILGTACVPEAISCAACYPPPAPAYCPPPAPCPPPACGPSPLFGAGSLCGGLLGSCTSICGLVLSLPSLVTAGLLAPPPPPPFAPFPSCGPPACAPMPQPCPPPRPVMKCKPAPVQMCPPPTCYAPANVPTYPPVGAYAGAPVPALMGPIPGIATFAAQMLEMPFRLVSGGLSPLPPPPLAPIAAKGTDEQKSTFGCYW